MSTFSTSNAYAVGQVQSGIVHGAVDNGLAGISASAGNVLVSRDALVREMRRELQQAFDREVVPHLVELGALKATLDREDPRVKEADHAAFEKSFQLIQSNPHHPIQQDLRNYYDLAHSFANGGSAAPFREFIEQTFDVRMHGAAELRESIRREPNTLVIFNHYNRGPEINGFVDRPDHGSNILGHDMTPIIAQILGNRAFSQADVQVSRFGLPLFKGDTFYYRATQEIGHQKISGDVNEIASQIQTTWARGKVPTLCPEAGLRSLATWRSGAVVSAAMANARTITIVAECPWISLMKPSKDFHFVASVPIPDAVLKAVREPAPDHPTRDAENRKVIATFNEQLRQTLGDFIVHKTSFSSIYRAAVADNIRVH